MGRGESKAGGGKPYGSEFSEILKSGNIKFVKYNGNNSTNPRITQTKGRVYVTVSEQTPGNYSLKSIVYFDKSNRRSKQIDLDHLHDGKKPHTHHGYNHNENDNAKGYANLTKREKAMVDRVEKIWNNYLNGK